MIKEQIKTQSRRMVISQLREERRQMSEEEIKALEIRELEVNNIHMDGRTPLLLSFDYRYDTYNKASSILLTDKYYKKIAVKGTVKEDELMTRINVGDIQVRTETHNGGETFDVILSKVIYVDKDACTCRIREFKRFKNINYIPNSNNYYLNECLRNMVLRLRVLDNSMPMYAEF